MSSRARRGSTDCSVTVWYSNRFEEVLREAESIL